MILRLTSGEQTTKFSAHSAIFEWWKMLVSQNSKLSFPVSKLALFESRVFFPFCLVMHRSLALCDGQNQLWGRLRFREAWIKSQKIFLGSGLVKITPSTKWILYQTIYITQVSISSFLSCDRRINLNTIFFYDSIYRFY